MISPPGVDPGLILGCCKILQKKNIEMMCRTDKVQIWKVKFDSSKKHPQYGGLKPFFLKLRQR